MLKRERYARRWSRATVAISACLILLSTSCTEKPKPVPAPRLIYVLPPTALLQRCENSPFEGVTFGDAVIALQVKQSEISICSSRIDAVIKWIKDIQNKEEDFVKLR
ncbi:Rz1-like lysis system protein LysC [Serratia fonticola]|uniref:Rz1-like lysis system protein LysC n=1 Tax=Serratia fonticola TaxID=47917 RepID=UPI003CC91436